jgi:hypothetical protein
VKDKMNSDLHPFQTLLVEVGVEFTPPPGFVPCPVQDNSVFAYQYALRSPSGDLELRYRIDSFARLEAERKAASAGMEMIASVSINDMYVTNFTALLYNLSEGVFAKPMLFDPEPAAELYGADRAALCFVRMAAKGFSPDYDAACVFSFHKENVADAYIIGLYNKGSGADCFFDEPPELRFV